MQEANKSVIKQKHNDQSPQVLFKIENLLSEKQAS